MINTEYYWEGMLFGFDFYLKLVYFIWFLILTICWLRQLFLVIKERFKNKPRVYTILIVGSLLGLIFAKPFGVIDFEKFEGRDKLVAMQEGAANCTITLKLKENDKFTLTSFCFGEDKIYGTYSINKDTIKLKNSILNEITKRYEYGIYKKATGEILLYHSQKDTMPYPLTVFKNELIK
jgi:hypothetical protein